MERTFIIFRFEGTVLHLCRSDRVNKMSLKDCLDKVYNTYYDRDTEKLFKSHDLSFEREELTLSELTDKIGKGLAVFPISKLQEIEEVKRYIELGLDPVFMRVTDFRAFKRVYGD